MFLSCTKSYLDPDVFDGAQSFDNDFADGGGGWGEYYSAHYLSPRNRQYTFEITENNTNVVFSLTSKDANTTLYMYNELGQRLYPDVVPISEEGSRKSGFPIKLNKGTYTIIACGWREEITDFTLKIAGNAKNVSEKTYQTIDLADQFSGNALGSFTEERSFNDYSFEVTENNTWIDITAKSTDTKNYMVITDINGQDVQRSYLVTADYISSQVFKINKKGTYKLSVRTDSRNTNKLKLSLVGHVSNLKKMN